MSAIRPVGTAGAGRAMPKLISGALLRKAVEDQTFIKDGVPSSAEAVKYDFHLGDRVLKARFRQPKDIEKIDEEHRQVDPGEAVFVLTKERLDLPANMIAILAPKRKLAHDGIIMLGGLAVDPLYRGHLLIGLYNFSSTPFPLMPGRKLIGAAFYELAKAEIGDYAASTPAEITDFPDELVKLIQNYRPIGLNALEERVSDAVRQVEALKADLISDKEWRQDFKTGLEQHNVQLGKLIEGLDKETKARESADDKLTHKLESMSNMFFGLKLVWWVVGLVVAGGIGALLRHLFV